MALALIEKIRDLDFQIADLHRRIESIVTVGTISDVDSTKGYRVNLVTGTDGNPFKTDWLPHPESGGTVSTWMPLSVGQTVSVFAPSGDLEMAFLGRNGFSDQNPQPSSDLGEVVLLHMGTVRISATAAGINLTVGATSIVIGANDITLNGQTVHAIGAALKHNDKSVGDTHTHGGIIPGGDSTLVPD